MNMLRPSWSSQRRRQPGVRLADLAACLGTTEVELLAADCGRAYAPDRVVRLRPDWPALVDALPDLGRVATVVRNGAATLERLGRHGRARQPGDFTLTLATARWASAFAAIAPGRRTRARSLHLFDEYGAAAIEVFLEPEGDAAAFDVLVRTLRHDDQSPVEAVVVPPPAAVPDDDEGASVRRVAPAALAAVLSWAADARAAVEIAVASRGAEQLWAGRVERVVRLSGCTHVLDDTVRLHVREDAIDAAHVVHRATPGGLVSALVLSEASGEPAVVVHDRHRAGAAAWRHTLRALPSA